MRSFTASLWLAVILIFLASAPPAQATIVTTYTQPDAGYITVTTLIPVIQAEYSDVVSETDGAVTATFSKKLNVRDTGSGWATWNSPPYVESSTPKVLFTNGVSSLNIAFSAALYLFGIEVQPDSFDVTDVTIEYYFDALLLGSITRSINGDSGALLLAGYLDTPFNNVQVYTANEDDFAIAKLRYSQTQPEGFDPVPEPSTFLLVAATFVLVAFGYFCKKLWKL